MAAWSTAEVCKFRNNTVISYTINVSITDVSNKKTSVANDAKHLCQWQANTLVLHDN